MCIKWFKKKEQVENKPHPIDKVIKILLYDNISSIIRINKNNFILVEGINYCRLSDFNIRFNIWTFSKNNILIINHDFDFDSKRLWRMYNNNGIKIAKNWIVNILENCVSQQDYTTFRNNIRRISNNIIHHTFPDYDNYINRYHNIHCNDIIDKIKRDDLANQSFGIRYQGVLTSYYIDDNNDMRNELENLYDKRNNIIRKHSTYPIYS